MKQRMLDILECPFCGDGLYLQTSPEPDVSAGEVRSGILGCQCCAYPVVDGIPVIDTGPAVDEAMELIGARRVDDALKLMLGLNGTERAARFDALLSEPARLTFRAALEVLCSDTDAEGAYLLYRFSDPTFLCAQAVLRATLAARPGSSTDPTRVLDVGGGAGHLARAVGESLPPGSEVVVADLAFWKLWLARRFVAPDCHPVCCDAEHPLPFARAAFAFTYSVDAINFIWPRRLLAGELMRATRVDAPVVLCHVHNALCENESAGMPLTPAGWRHLFEVRQPSLFRERDVLDALVNRRPLELGVDRPDAELADEPALELTAGVVPGEYAVPARRRPQNLHLNPLYAPVDGSRTARLQSPSDFYAEEFGACRRYLPEEVELPEGWAERWRRGERDARMLELFDRHVLLDLPENYL